MMLQGLGPAMIARLLRSEGAAGREPTTDWLLYGPTDPEVVEPPPALSVPRLAAE